MRQALAKLLNCLGWTLTCYPPVSASESVVLCYRCVPIYVACLFLNCSECDSYNLPTLCLTFLCLWDAFKVHISSSSFSNYYRIFHYVHVLCFHPFYCWWTFDLFVNWNLNYQKHSCMFFFFLYILLCGSKLTFFFG